MIIHRFTLTPSPSLSQQIFCRLVEDKLLPASITLYAVRAIKSEPHKINYNQYQKQTASTARERKKENPLHELEVRVKIKLKKLKMYEVQSSYVVFICTQLGRKGERKGYYTPTRVDQHHSSVNEQLIGIFLLN